MHSQQTFNECIAQTGFFMLLVAARDGLSHEKREKLLRPHEFSSQIEWVGFNVLPSSGLAGETAEHHSASSSEVPRRT